MEKKSDVSQEHYPRSILKFSLIFFSWLINNKYIGITLFYQEMTGIHPDY